MEPLAHGQLFQLGIDTKYGRVFVENPPARMLALINGTPEEREQAKQEFGDEPLFVLRGVDPETPQTILDYARNVRESDQNVRRSREEFAMAADRRSDEIVTWQTENEARVKVAD